MQMPAFDPYHIFPDTLKGWEARDKNRAEWYAYWAYIAKRRFHALPEDKGTPVPHTGKYNRRKYANGSGVSANSRILSHRYADEGEKGTLIRREIRRKERAQWLMDAAWEMEGPDASTVAQWFYDKSDDVDSDRIPSVYTVGETVVEWPREVTYGYAYDDYDYDPYDYYGTFDYMTRVCDICDGPCDLD